MFDFMEQSENWSPPYPYPRYMAQLVIASFEEREDFHTLVQSRYGKYLYLKTTPHPERVSEVHNWGT